MSCFDFILFGATGDLAMRKLFPSLFQAYSNNLINKNIQIIATGRTEMDTQEFIEKLNTYSRVHIRGWDEDLWSEFTDKIQYKSIDIQNKEEFRYLKENIKTENVIIYLSISPKFFKDVCENLAYVALNSKFVKIVLEKPLGVDLNSCIKINDGISKYFKEEQIYRIDHYLGKESVQNILTLRLANSFLESLLNKKHIKNVQITIFEQLGVEARGEFYDQMGALRDMIQNHIVQIMCLIGMELPLTFDAQSIRNKKLEFIKSLKRFEKSELENFIIRGQYTKNGEFNGYKDEYRIKSSSTTETFVALKTEINHEKWEGVPFYLRTGKRMAHQFVEVVFVFKEGDKDKVSLFGKYPNKLIIKLQPEHSINLSLRVKKMGKDMKLERRNLSLDLLEKSNSRHMEAYERLILDLIDNDSTFFNHKDELEASWQWLTPVLESFRDNEIPLYLYPANTLGPKEADSFIKKDGNSWNNE